MFGTLKAFVVEVFWIAKTTVSTLWFWVPIAYALYFIIQLWMIFYIHPLTAFGVATILALYGIWLENRRVMKRYGLKKTQILSATHLFGAGPEPIKGSNWEVERTVEQYEQLLKGQKRKKKKA